MQSSVNMGLFSLSMSERQQARIMSWLQVKRLRAAAMAGLKEIPAIIVDVGEDDSAIMALIENLQREDLGYMEEAEGYRNLIKEHGLTQEELAQKIGKSQSTIANKIRILRLSPMVKKILKITVLQKDMAGRCYRRNGQLKVLQKFVKDSMSENRRTCAKSAG